jgi:2-phosphosulfolactate phosphatase
VRRFLITAGLPEARAWQSDCAFVVVDVIRSTTTAATALAAGRRCLPVGSVEEAWKVARTLDHPLLIGERGGGMPEGFELTNSPYQLSLRRDPWRPAVLLSSSGTPLLRRLAHHDAVYAACLRNARATAALLAARHDRVALLGAPTRGEFREEDQQGCVVIAARLATFGFLPDDDATSDCLRRWAGAPPDAFVGSASVAWLARTKQLHDLEFILRHLDDLDEGLQLVDGELRVIAAEGGHGTCTSQTVRRQSSY